MSNVSNPNVALRLRSAKAKPAKASSEAASKMGIAESKVHHDIRVLSSSVRGVVEAIGPKVVSGWAADFSEPAMPVTVELLIDDVVVAETLADRARPDLENFNLGSVKFGYRFVLVDSRINSLPQLRVKGSNTLLEPLEGAFRCEGVVEHILWPHVVGWAWRVGQPDEVVSVDLLFRGKHLASAAADVFRDHLAASGIGNGAHGFEMTIEGMDAPPDFTFADIEVVFHGTQDRLQVLPLALKQVGEILGESSTHTEKVLPEPSPIATSDFSVRQELAPPVVEQGVSVIGSIDSLDHAQIRGWAQIVGHKEKPAYLELLIDGQSAAYTCADLFRDDLKRAGIGDGRHAFSFQTPLRLLDGKTHSVHLLAVNSNAMVPPGKVEVKLNIPLPLHYFMQACDIVDTATKKLDALKSLLAPEIGDAILKRTSVESDYQLWYRRHCTIDGTKRVALLGTALQFKFQPKFSILLPTYNTPPGMLREAIESVRSQLYPNWELCIADDASTSSSTLAVLQEYETLDDRIKIVYRPQNGHISEATNSALELATSDYICFFDHDDLLAEDALYHFARTLNEGSYDLLYSDEDKIDNSGVHQDPHFKPSFNYTLLLSYNYVCHLLCVKKELVDQVGGFRSETNGSQDHDFILRCIERTNPSRIKHIPHVLYHWRVHAGSTAASIGAKNYAVAAGELAIQSHLDKVSPGALVQAAPVFGYKVSWPMPQDPPLVSVIIPTRDQAGILAMCLSGLLNKTSYQNIEVIIVDNGSVEQKTFDLFSTASRDKRVRIIKHDAPFNYSEICNRGVRESSGSLLLMLNNDIEVLEPNWLSELVSQVCRPGVGAVGAKLLYPDRRVQHAGVILGIGGVAGHAHKMFGQNEPGYMARSIVAHELSACTAACLLVDRKVYEQVIGFNEKELSVAFNDVDLCLKIREVGYSVVFTPQATLVHHESVSRGLEDVPAKLLRAHAEIAYMLARWGDVLKNDPFYSPNLTLKEENFLIDTERG